MGAGEMKQREKRGGPRTGPGQHWRNGCGPKEALTKEAEKGRSKGWYKLHSKVGKKEKERGEIQVTVQFTRNNLSASMFDLSVKDKPRSPFGKIKDKMKGKKKFELESASAIIPSSALDDPDLLGGSNKKAKAKTFFLRNKLRKSSLTQSNTSLGSDSTLSSASGSLAWPGSDYLSRSPSRHSRLSTDGGRDSAPSPKLLTHKRAYSDEVSQVQAGPPRAGHDPGSGSTLCINGSHIYSEEPPAPPAHRASISGPFPSASALHGISLRRAEEATGHSDAVPWGRSGHGGSSETVAMAEREEPRREERKPRMGLFHHHHHHGAGRRGSLGDKTAPALAAAPHPSSSGEERSKSGWFGSREGKEQAQKPSLDVSPQVEPGPDAPAPPPPGSLPCSPPVPVPAAAAARMLSTNLFAPAAATAFASPPPPSPRYLGPTNPFLPSLQSNPFFEELVADKALKFASPARSLPSGSLGAAPTVPSLPEWDDTFNAFAASRLSPDAGRGSLAPAAETGPEEPGPVAFGAPWSGCDDTGQAEPEDPRGGGGGTALALEAPGPLSPEGRRAVTAGWQSPVFQEPSPSLSAKWRSLSQEPEEDGTFSLRREADQGPGAGGPLRRAGSEGEKSSGPGAPRGPRKEPLGQESQLFQELSVITDLWSSEMLKVTPVSESLPPIPKRSWEQEEILWGVLDEPGGPAPPPDSPGDVGREVFSLPPETRQASSEELRPATPPPKPPRLFTPLSSQNSQSEEKEMLSKEGTEPWVEDIFLNLQALSQQGEPQGSELQGSEPQGSEPRGSEPEDPKSEGPKSEGLNPQGPDPQGPELQKPEPQKPEPQKSESQEPEPQGPELQKPEPQEPEPQGPEPQEPELQEPEPQEPELQEPELQKPELQEPKPQELQGLQLLAPELPGSNPGLEEPERCPSAERVDLRAFEGGSVSCWEPTPLVPQPSPPPAVLEMPSPTPSSESTAGRSQLLWAVQEPESPFLGMLGPLRDKPEPPGLPAPTALKKDPFWGSDGEDNASSPPSSHGSPASLVLPALPSTGDEASPESPGLEPVAPQDPLPARPSPPSLPPPCSATNVSRKPGQESLSLHGSRPLSFSTPALVDFPATRGPFEFPSPTEGPSIPQWAIETPSALLALLPLETRPAEEPPSQRGTSPHPVKPLSSAPPEGAADRKPPRSSLSSALTSGLEKLKTVTSGNIQLVAPQADQTAESKVKLKDPSQPDQSAKYYHLTHDELIALLLQRERELSRRDEHVHELESYIDQLLVRIMETSPTLLQIPPGPRAPK
ncbi:rab11 family-interacting protein 5 isoform X2 [Sarcophilus harrisii]|uniref:rab11 family-interacting protein 5 isoform X2 n=1 Tax=Sarcophilus harrisii TaxID=9305 RepID=UPI001301F813|nr:rab11 family-interacting protein 5 isoform X2 [Sarcophilus harrisii]